ncbi:unnamed protein product [Arabidopsis lyrata]|nr:unnamed protein product [Arabidopsis lyrata]
MSHLYSCFEKGKWPAVPHKFSRRSPVKIPAEDNSAIIEANRLTLIGRATNPYVQKARAIIDFLPQFWNLEGRWEKHCFSLAHEKKHCPHLSSSRPLGVNQLLTLTRLDENKRHQGDRKRSRSLFEQEAPSRPNDRGGRGSRVSAKDMRDWIRNNQFPPSRATSYRQGSQSSRTYAATCLPLGVIIEKLTELYNTKRTLHVKFLHQEQTVPEEKVRLFQDSSLLSWIRERRISPSLLESHLSISDY